MPRPDYDNIKYPLDAYLVGGPGPSLALDLKVKVLDPWTHFRHEFMIDVGRDRTGLSLNIELRNASRQFAQFLLTCRVAEKSHRFPIVGSDMRASALSGALVLPTLRS